VNGFAESGPNSGKAVAMELEHEWAVILAGGDGTRLRSLTRRITGDERPKQFCPVLGDQAVVEETRKRVALEVAREPNRVLASIQMAGLRPPWMENY
jgi:Nucleotidyl transferase